MQTGTNVGTAIANQVGGMVNQVTPYGNLNYNQTGSYTYTDPTSGKSYQLPKWTATQSLTPAGQSIQNATMQTQQNLANMARDQSARVAGLLSKPMDMSGVVARKAVPTLSMVSAADKLKREFADSGAITKDYDTNYENDRQRVEAAMMQRMQPQMQQSRSALEDRLRQQGLTVGSAGWDRAIASQNAAENDARLATVLAGGQEQSRLVNIAAQRAGFQNAAQAQQYGQDLGRASFWNQGAQGDFTNQVTRVGMNNASQMDMWRAQEAARAASLNEAYQARNQPLNEISAMMSGSQVQAPSFMNTQGLNMPTTDYAGLINQNYKNQLGAYNTQMENWNGLWGGLIGGGLGLYRGALA